MIDVQLCLQLRNLLLQNPEIWHHYYPPYESKNFIVWFLSLSLLYETFSPWVWSLAYLFTKNLKIQPVTELEMICNISTD